MILLIWQIKFVANTELGKKDFYLQIKRGFIEN